MLCLTVIFKALPVIGSEMVVFEESDWSYAAIQDILSHHLILRCVIQIVLHSALHVFLSLQGTFSHPFIVCTTDLACV